MFEDLADGIALAGLDEGDDPHGPAALGAKQWVGLVDVLDEHETSCVLVSAPGIFMNKLSGLAGSLFVLGLAGCSQDFDRFSRVEFDCGKTVAIDPKVQPKFDAFTCTYDRSGFSLYWEGLFSQGIKTRANNRSPELNRGEYHVDENIGFFALCKDKYVRNLGFELYRDSSLVQSRKWDIDSDTIPITYAFELPAGSLRVGDYEARWKVNGKKAAVARIKILD